MKSTPRYNAIIEIPLHWTPEQADAITEFLAIIDEAIWNLYGDDLVNLAKEHNVCKNDDTTRDIANYDINEDIPF